jgi:hypothetical protein
VTVRERALPASNAPASSESQQQQPSPASNVQLQPAPAERTESTNAEPSTAAPSAPSNHLSAIFAAHQRAVAAPTHREIVHFLKLANEKALMLLVPYRSSHSSTTRDAPLLPIITCLSTSLALTVIVSFEMSLILSKFPDQPSSRKQVWYQCVLPHLPHNDHTGFSITAQPWIS